jgi:hypothetical protein
MEENMTYLILVIGLILIYFALKRDKKSSNLPVQARAGETEIDNPEIDSIREDLNYLMVKIEELENSVAIMSEMMNYTEQSRIESKNSKAIESFNEVLQKNINENQVINTVSQKNNDINDIRDTIYELYDRGKSVDEISSILRIGKGEVSLRLGLRKLNN